MGDMPLNMLPDEFYEQFLSELSINRTDDASESMLVLVACRNLSLKLSTHRSSRLDASGDASRADLTTRGPTKQCRVSHQVIILHRFRPTRSFERHSNRPHPRRIGTWFAVQSHDRHTNARRVALQAPGSVSWSETRRRLEAERWQWVARPHIQGEPALVMTIHNVILTPSSVQAVTSFVNPGDPVFLEAPMYPYVPKRTFM